MSIGSNIKKRRFELRMSQQDLADALGYKSRSTIAKIESGKNDVTQKKLRRFAEVLDTTVEALILGVHKTPSHPRIATVSMLEKYSAEECEPDGQRTKAVAVILAGGKSSRNRQNIPNQFINILGKPVIVYCLEAYQAHPTIDDIYIVCLKGWEQIVNAYSKQYNISKLRGLIPASSSGILSVKNGLEFIEKQYSVDDIIVFQESTRPMVTVDMISKLLHSCLENGSANICQSMRDYVQFQYLDGKSRYVDRDSVVCIQSPEAYRFSIIRAAFEKAKKEQLPLTESCCAMLMYKLGYKINFVENDANNIKIVRQEDIAIATPLLKLQ